jgi:hypothetical protein
MEGRFRKPLQLKGTRTRFRTHLKKCLILPRPGLRFRTDIDRQKRLVVVVTKGTDADVDYLGLVLNGSTFETLPVVVVSRRS